MSILIYRLLGRTEQGLGLNYGTYAAFRNGSAWSRSGEAGVDGNRRPGRSTGTPASAGLLRGTAENAQPPNLADNRPGAFYRALSAGLRF